MRVYVCIYYFIPRLLRGARLCVYHTYYSTIIYYTCTNRPQMSHI